MTRLLVVIPARGGSKGIPGKNLHEVGGVSLVGRAVLRARAFLASGPRKGKSRILVDTDDPRIAEEGRRWGGDVPFLRASELARDETSTLASIEGLLERLGEPWDALLLLQPTSPFARAADIAACHDRFAPPGTASVVSVTSGGHPLPLAMRTGVDGRLSWASGSPPGEVRRQAHEPVVWPNGAVYLASIPWLLDRRAFVVGGESVGVEIPWTRAMDVDEPSDLEMARRLASGEEAPPWPGSPARAGVPTVLDALPSGDAGGHAMLQAAGSLEATATRILEARGQGVDAVALALPGDGTSTTAGLAQIVPLRNVFQVPTCWDVQRGTLAEAVNAVALGVSAVAGAIPRDLVGAAAASRVLQ
jgi:CMP-N,N'-diacetyllegionaminic acid synthase